MNKIFVIALIFMLFSCGYKKEKEVFRESGTNDPSYCIWIYRDSKIIKCLHIPIDSASCENISKLDKEADDLIKKMKSAEQCQ